MIDERGRQFEICHLDALVKEEGHSMRWHILLILAERRRHEGCKLKKPGAHNLRIRLVFLLIASLSRYRLIISESPRQCLKLSKRFQKYTSRLHAFLQVLDKKRKRRKERKR